MELKDKKKKIVVIILAVIAIISAVLAAYIIKNKIEKQQQEARIKEEQLQIEIANKEYEKYKQKIGKEVKGFTFSDGTSKEIKDIKWQVFYIGKINENDENEEERIYLISKDYIPNKLLPKQEYTKYKGSESITKDLQKYNKDYFSKYKSTNTNMKVTAYMMDTNKWNKFKMQEAEFAIGGPTVELLFNAYNKYKRLNGNEKYVSQAEDNIGYKVSNDGGQNYDYYINNAIFADDIPYTMYNNGKYTGYWLASPSQISDEGEMCVEEEGHVINAKYDNKNYGYRLIVCLNSGVKLEETPTGSIKIVSENV